MGPGILLKALLRGSFSLMVFGWAQIIMDIQPLLVMITGAGHLHGFSHTYLGATLLAAVAALSGKYLAEVGLRMLTIATDAQPIVISWRLASVSALIGCYSHVLLDSVMHGDLHPYYPFAADNPMLGFLDSAQIYLLCLITGAIGSVIYFAVPWLRKRQPD